RSAGTQGAQPGRSALAPRAAAEELGTGADWPGVWLSSARSAGGALECCRTPAGRRLSGRSQPGHRFDPGMPGAGTAFANAAAGLVEDSARTGKTSGTGPCGVVQRLCRGRADSAYGSAGRCVPGATGDLRAGAGRSALAAGRWATSAVGAGYGAGLPAAYLGPGAGVAAG